MTARPDLEAMVAGLGFDTDHPAYGAICAAFALGEQHGRLEENEACAALAEDHAPRVANGPTDVAYAIRARKP